MRENLANLGILQTDQVDYLRLLRSILQNRRTIAATVNLLESQPKTVKRWLGSKSNEELLRFIEPDSRLKILSAAHEIGLPFEEFAIGTPIWDFEKSYSENLAANPETMEERPRSRPVRTHFFDWELDSPFGPSSSVLTADRYKTFFLLQRWNSVATTKSYRSRKKLPRDPRNLAYCRVPPEEVTYEDTTAGLRVGLVPRFEPASLGERIGLMNRFEAPSDEPSVWKDTVSWLKGRLGARQLIIVSILPTDWESGGPESLRTDLRLLVNEAADAGAEVIEINCSCPNGLDSETSSNPKKLQYLCESLKLRFPSIKFLLKLGPVNQNLAGEIVEATSRNVHGYSLINAVPSCASSQEGFFNQGDGGLSGPPILRVGLSSVRAMRSALKDLKDHVIIGIGGVTDPVHVTNYLDQGASLVQAASIFFEDTLFGPKVMGHLSRQGDIPPRGPREYREAVEENTIRAILQVQRERPDVMPLKVSQCGMSLLAHYQGQVAHLASRGPWRAPHALSVGEICREIQNRLGAKR